MTYPRVTVHGVDPSFQKALHRRMLNFLNRDSTRKANRRGRADRITPAFEVDTPDAEPAEDGVYDGPATVRAEDCSHHARVRLTGRIDPIDGHYHWQGTVFDIDLGDRPPTRVVVEIGDRAASARLTERMSSSAYSVVGVGPPPFGLDWIEVEVPLL